MTASPPRICLIECWFGTFSPWFSFYLRTCASNPTVSYLIFHDTAVQTPAPPNVRFIPLSRAELEKRGADLLGAPVQLKTGFKVCDLRPAFGILFAEFLTDFEYWGYNDSDLFWGDIRKFVTPDILSAHDIITSCRTSVCGQFTLFRNAGATRDVFRLIPGFVEALSKPEPHYLDEHVLDAAASDNGQRQRRSSCSSAVIWTIGFGKRAPAGGKRVG